VAIANGRKVDLEAFQQGNLCSVFNSLLHGAVCNG